ncbi:MAG TPA: CorA family divalent cation transporter [Candidatus Limnocylindrales bacterium]|nr:CorA family divalent cation transporter [Candidatus Limnocylindrales bacterium]
MSVRAVLYDANGEDRDLDLVAEQEPELSSARLLWVDVDDADPDGLAAVARTLELEPSDLRRISAETRRPELLRLPDRVVLRLGAVEPEDDEALRHELVIVVGKNHVVTFHDGPLAAIDAFREDLEEEPELGRLDAAPFAIALIDSVLTAYFRQIERIERDIDALDELAVRSRREQTFLASVLRLRRRIARVRQTLVPNREALAPLGRPDFELRSDLGAIWPGLIDRLERAIDAIENSRELLVGSMDLYLGRASQRTNDVMKVLTLVSAILLPGALLAGIMGMNFQVPFFSDSANFYVVLGAMGVMAIAILALARWRAWI